jgi:(E)-4-hydroxy-3-methylbut-2-enyl-diphosphate synthase
LKKTKVINIGNVKIGGNNLIAIQSMTNKKNVDDIINQINDLEREGCEIVRCAVPDNEMAEAIKTIKSKTNIPIVADIHFDYRLALKAIENGVDKIRINPGNIGSLDRVETIINKAKEYEIPIRIGVNSGSLEKVLLEKYGSVTPEALVESVIKYVNFCEERNFYNLILSVKSSSVKFSIDAYKILFNKTNYPLHVGITATGISPIKSSVGIGIILHNGIGDTIRVSLADDPLKEVQCAKEILSALEIRKFGIEFIVCPTCGRTKINLIEIANKVQDECMKNENIKNKNITVAIMGCAVNGPGEAKNADIGIAGGDGFALLFKKGKIIKKISQENIIKELINEIILAV